MKKLLAILFLIMTVQGIAETVVKGTYETKKKRYVELTETFEKEIFLNYTLPDDKKEIVTYRDDDYDILVNKNDLLEVYNKGRNEPITDIKSKITYKDTSFKKLGPIYNDFAELIENNKAVVYDRNKKEEIKYLVKVKYINAIYYNEGGGSMYDGYKFYKDKEWTEPVLKFDIVTQYGIAIHSSLGDNPYNRELSEKEKERIKKYDEKFNEEKDLYQRAMQTPDVTQSFSY